MHGGGGRLGRREVPQVNATHIYDKGLTDLVSVMPPDAEIAPESLVAEKDRGKAPGIRRSDGLWVGYSFLSGPSSREDVRTWDSWGANVGLLGTRFPGLDIDCDDAFLAGVAVEAATEVLGEAPVRLSREPRRLLVYRAEEPMAKMKARIRYRGEDHFVELLGQGQQYLIHGKHQSGSEYGWETDPAWEWREDDLPAITEHDVKLFFAKLANKLEGRAEVEVRGRGRSSGPPPVQESLLAPDEEALSELMGRLPNEYPDRDAYITIGHAVKAAGGPFEVWMEWCQRWTGGHNDEATVRADWDRMRPPFRVGWQYLCRELYDRLGVPVPVTEFKADPNAKPLTRPSPKSVEKGTGYSDAWAADRVAERIRPKLRFVPLTNRWHEWDGSAWVLDQTNRAEHEVRQGLLALSRKLKEEAFNLPAEAKELKSFLLSKAAGLQSNAAFTKAYQAVRSHPGVTATPEDFNTYEWRLNTPGGIVDLLTGEVCPSDPDELHSLIAAVSPGDEEPTRWLTYLSEATQGDEDLMRFLQKMVGYSLTGSTREQVFTFVHGPTGTGKSVFLRTVAGLLGSYHKTASAETFARAREGRHPTDVAGLVGARLVTASETQEGRAWDAERIKSLTGGDSISVRFMRQDFFEAVPDFKIIIVGNHEPKIEGGDAAVMRRLRIVPFENKPANCDLDLLDKLKQEWPGIMRWAVEGCLLWQREGLEPPAVVEERTERYASEEDLVGAFVGDRCDVGEGLYVTRGELYGSWRSWCHETGERPGPLKDFRRQFASAIRRHELEADKRGYKGIGLKKEALV